MKWDAREEEPCSLARAAIGVIGDPLEPSDPAGMLSAPRGGSRAFSPRSASPAHLLAERLTKKLVRQGVLRRIPLPGVAQTPRIYPHPKGP